jgi:hypothetical protein
MFISKKNPAINQVNGMKNSLLLSIFGHTRKYLFTLQLWHWLGKKSKVSL